MVGKNIETSSSKKSVFQTRSQASQIIVTLHIYVAHAVIYNIDLFRLLLAFEVDKILWFYFCEMFKWRIPARVCAIVWEWLDTEGERKAN